jgi:hypothetical protein
VADDSVEKRNICTFAKCHIYVARKCTMNTLVKCYLLFFSMGSGECVF